MKYIGYVNTYIEKKYLIVKMSQLLFIVLHWVLFHVITKLIQEPLGVLMLRLMSIKTLDLNQIMLAEESGWHRILDIVQEPSLGLVLFCY